MTPRAWKNAIILAVTCWAIIAGCCVTGILIHNALAAERCTTIAQCHRAIDWQAKDRAQLKRELRHRDDVSLHQAIAISSRLFDVSESAMTCIAWHESGYGRQLTSEAGSGALGPFQWLASSWATTPLGRAGYSRLDPLAASLSTAQRVIQDGGWREWVTGPGCGL